MRFVGFLVLLGGTYAIAHALGASTGWASGIAWAAALLGAVVAHRIRLYRAYARDVLASPEYRENQRRANEFFGLTPASSGGEVCPACGQNEITSEGAVWICDACVANGPIVAGLAIDVGIRGNPRGGDYEQYRPAVPVARQLAGEVPELAHFDDTLTSQLDLAYYDWYFQLTGTTFDIEDNELEEAEAMHARNVLGDPALRADDARFYTLTAASTAGWQWRRAEQVGYEPSASGAAHSWAERYRGRTIGGRSETIALIAAAISTEDGALEQHSPGGAAFLAAGWLLVRDGFFGALPEPVPHSVERLEESFRFGVALRDAQVVYDAALTS
jgi:hypothetical protein